VRKRNPKKVTTLQKAMTKKVVIFSEKKTLLVAAPGDTNPGNATLNQSIN